MPSGTDDVLRFEAQLEQKQTDLPPFVRVPASVLPWRLEGTTTVLLIIAGVDAGRRSLKRWHDDLWFIDVPASFCSRAGLSIGRIVTVEITLASTALPAELEKLIADDPDARAAWEALSTSRQRMIRESVAQAKRPETRQRRARRLLCGPG